jgi:hypothetical protein
VPGLFYGTDANGRKCARRCVDVARDEADGDGREHRCPYEQQPSEACGKLDQVQGLAPREAGDVAGRLAYPLRSKPVEARSLSVSAGRRSACVRSRPTLHLARLARAGEPIATGDAPAISTPIGPIGALCYRSEGARGVSSTLEPLPSLPAAAATGSGKETTRRSRRLRRELRPWSQLPPRKLISHR